MLSFADHLVSTSTISYKLCSTQICIMYHLKGIFKVLLVDFIATLVSHMMEIKHYKSMLIRLHLSSTWANLWAEF